MAKASDPALVAQVRQACRDLHLPTVAGRAQAVAEEAAREAATHLSYLAVLLEAELDDRPSAAGSAGSQRPGSPA